MKLCFNGKIQKAEPVTVSPFLRGHEYGLSVFETLRTYHQTEVFHLDTHLERLATSIEMMGISLPEGVTIDEIKQNLLILVEENKLEKEDLRIKIFVCEDYYWIRMRVLDLLPDLAYAEGVEVVDATFVRPFPKIKASSLAYHHFTKLQSEGVWETIFFDQRDNLREGNISNVFAVFGDIVVTPDSDILEGVTRSVVIQKIETLGYALERREISREELLTADGIFLTNTTKEVVPVRKWGDWEGADFRLAQLLRERFSSSPE